MKTTLLLLFLVLNALFLSSRATTYYVSPSGKNIDAGTSVSKPWQSIVAVNAKNFNGDTILFQGGSTFPGSMYFTSADIGTSTRPIVISSYGTGKATINSDTAYGIYVYNAAGLKLKNIIFKGSGRTTNKQSGILIYMNLATTILSYINIDNVETYGYFNSGISIGSWNKFSGFRDVSITNSLSHDNGKAGISFYAETSFVHKNIYLGYNKTYNNSGISTFTTGNSGNGIVVGNVDGGVIEYCTSYNNGWLHSNSYGGPMGIWGYASNNLTIQFNQSYQNKTGSIKDGGGFDLDGCSNSIMQYNYSHDNYGAGFLIAKYTLSPVVNNIIVRYNISENDSRKNDYGMIHFVSSGSAVGVKNVQVYNNSVYVTPKTNTVPKALFVRSGTFSNINIRNNIFQTTGSVIMLNVASTGGFTFQGNDYWSTGSTFKILWGSTTYSSLSAWRTATGKEKINGNASGYQLDPQFSDTTTGVIFSDATQITQLKRYKLKSTSGILNKGLNLKDSFALDVGTRDFWGNSLVNKHTFNIGAYQITTTPKPVFVLNDGAIESFENKSLTVQSFPNPFNSSSIVSFVSPTSGKATIALYDIEGKLIRSLFTGEIKAGENKKLTLNATGLTSGIYILRLSAEGKVLTKQIIRK